jgi:DNA polymerase-3 subunit delta
MDKNRVVLIHGRQRVLVQEELGRIIGKFSERENADLNLNSFEAGEHPLDDVFSALDTLPMGSTERLVVVREAQRWNRSEVKRLASFLESFSGNAVLVLAAVDLRRDSPLLKVVEERGRVKKLEKKVKDIPSWLRRRFRDHGLDVDGKALAYLVESLGDDVEALDKAVEKIALYHLDESGNVDLDDVLHLVSPSLEASLFELQDRVGVGDTEQALKILHRLVKGGEKPNYILAALSRHHRRLVRYVAMKEEGLAEKAIAERLGVQPWVVERKIRPQASRLDRARLGGVLSLLLRLETAVKRGEMDYEVALEAAVTQLCRFSSPPRRRGRKRVPG